MAAPNNSSPLWGKFREEVDSHLLILSKGLVALEKDPHNNELLKDIFRGAHTIKGSARMMGFKDISDVAHEMETVLGEMRDGRLSMGPHINDLLFEGIDAITNLVDAIMRGDKQNIDTSDLKERLRQLSAPPKEEEPPATGNVEIITDAPPTTTVAEKPPETIITRAPVNTSPARIPAQTPMNVETAPPMPQFGQESISVRVDKLDTLMNLTGELVINRMQMEASLDHLHDLVGLSKNRMRTMQRLRDTLRNILTADRAQVIIDDLEDISRFDHQIEEMVNVVLEEYSNHNSNIETVANELEADIFTIRMLPVSTVFDYLSRPVRDLAREHNKDIELTITGGAIEVDKKILEGIKDPLIHIIRNAIDHGIEAPDARLNKGKPTQGKLAIRAYQKGRQVVVEVEDDGSGINPATIRRTAVRKGFLKQSEADALSDEDSIQLIFRSGFSTSPIITDVSGRGVGMDIVKTNIDKLNGQVNINSYVDIGTTTSLILPLSLATTRALLVRVGTQTYAIPSSTVVQMQIINLEDIRTVEGKEAIFILNRTMPLLRMEDVLPISTRWVNQNNKVNTFRPWLTMMSGFSSRKNGSNGSSNGNNGHSNEHNHNRNGSGIGMGRESQNYLQATSSVRDRTSAKPISAMDGSAPAVIVGSGERQICFLVDELLDERDNIVLKPLGRMLMNVEIVSAATILESGQVAIVLDVPAMIDAARSASGKGTLRRQLEASKNTAPRILVVDDSITTRELEKSILEASGYEVDIAMDGVEALQKLEHAMFDLVVTDVEMPRMDGFEFTQTMKSNPRIQQIPVIIVSSVSTEAFKRRGIEVGAQAYIVKGQFDQNNLLETIELLIG